MIFINPNGKVKISLKTNKYPRIQDLTEKND